MIIMLLATSSMQAQFLSFTNYTPITTATEGLRGPVKELELVELNRGYSEPEPVSMDTLYMHFDQTGRLLERNSLWHAEYPYERYIYSGDLLTEMIFWNQSDTIHMFFHYTTKGCLETVLWKYKNENDEMTENTTYIQCDEMCRIIKEEDNNKSTFYTYNQTGQLATMSGSYYSNTYEYDEQGNLTKCVLRNGDYTGITTYIRNSYGDVTEYHRTAYGTDENHHYKYTYDRHGNWLTRSEGSDITTRKITYYE